MFDREGFIDYVGAKSGNSYVLFAAISSMGKFLRFSKSACASKKILILILHLPTKIES